MTDQPVEPTGLLVDDDERDALAAIYAVNALDPAERDRVDAALAAADARHRESFAASVRGYRETMAQASAGTAVEPPAAVRAQILDAATPAAATPAAEDNTATVTDLDSRRRRLGMVLVAAAAVVVIAVGAAVGVAVFDRDEPTPIAEQVFNAQDVRTISGDIEGGGSATVVYSKEVGAGVLVMNNVAPPPTGSVYQMWLLGADAPAPAGTMGPDDVAPSTTAVLEGIDDASALGFSVESGPGATAPTEIFVQLPLAE